MPGAGDMERRLIRVSGVVQGVGFRPFVHAAATRLGLHGSVHNEGAGVRIEVEGEPGAIDRFLADLANRPPPLARIDSIRSDPIPARGEQRVSVRFADKRTRTDVGNPDLNRMQTLATKLVVLIAA